MASQPTTAPGTTKSPVLPAFLAASTSACSRQACFLPDPEPLDFYTKTRSKTLKKLWSAAENFKFCTTSSSLLAREWDALQHLNFVACCIACWPEEEGYLTQILCAAAMVLHVYGTQDSPNKHGVMGSKSVGEPPLLLSASALSAFTAAVAAAREDLSCGAKSGGSAGDNPAAAGAQSGDGIEGGARSGARAMSAASYGDVSAREAAVQELCAPVTVKAVRAAVGSLHLPTFLEQYA